MDTFGFYLQQQEIRYLRPALPVKVTGKAGLSVYVIEGIREKRA